MKRGSEVELMLAIARKITEQQRQSEVARTRALRESERLARAIARGRARLAREQEKSRRKQLQLSP